MPAKKTIGAAKSKRPAETPMPNLVVETWPVERLAPYGKNPRKNDAAVIKMAEAIKQYGFRIPIVARSDGEVVDGHLRLKAALSLGLKNVPVALADDLSPIQVKAFRLLANKSASWAEWDNELLLGELTGLMGQGFDLSLTGFADLELGTLGVAGFALEERLAEADEVPDPPKVPRVRLGELWLLGDHRLIIGDSTDAKTVERLLDGAVPNLMVTDPPYGVEYDPNWRNERARNSVGMGNRAIGAGAVGKVSNDSRADWQPAWALFPGDVAYVWCASLFSPVVEGSLVAAEFIPRALIIWDKTRLIIGRSDYHWQHEPCWYAVRKGKTGQWSGGRKQTTVWPIPHQKSETGHGTQKPIECMRRPILNNSKPGDAVYDPFSGSFTTGIACEMEGRRAFCCEIDPVYAEVSIVRWQNFTSKIATREDGKTLAQLKRKKAA